MHIIIACKQIQYHAMISTYETDSSQSCYMFVLTSWYICIIIIIALWYIHICLYQHIESYNYNNITLSCCFHVFVTNILNHNYHNIIALSYWFIVFIPIFHIKYLALYIWIIAWLQYNYEIIRQLYNHNIPQSHNSANYFAT